MRTKVAWWCRLCWQEGEIEAEVSCVPPENVSQIPEVQKQHELIRKRIYIQQGSQRSQSLCPGDLRPQNPRRVKHRFRDSNPKLID